MRRVLQTSALIAALTGAVLFTGACGDKDPDAKKQQVGGSNDDRHAAAVAYAKCMRENGDAAWPDPNAEGAFPNENGSLDRTSEAYKKANAACESKQPQGGGDAADFEARFQQLLVFSKCMRDNGVAKFPDPVKVDGGVGIDAPKDVDQNSAAYKKAVEACRSLPGAPVSGG